MSRIISDIFYYQAILRLARWGLLAATVSSAAVSEPSIPPEKIPLKINHTDGCHTSNVKSDEGNLFEDKSIKVWD